MKILLQTVFLGWGLMACTDRNLQMDFLSKNILASYQFEVTNTQNNNSDILPDNTNANLPFIVECSKSVVAIEVMNPQTSEWKDVKDVDAAAQVVCSESKTAQFALPLSFVGAPVNPSQPGDNRQAVQVRLSVKNLTGEINTYTKSYAALFAAPVLTLNAPDINTASAYGGASSLYPVSGTCSENAGTVQISAPFASTVNATCNAGAYSAMLTVTSAVPDGTPKIIVRHNPPAPVRAFSQTEKNINVDRNSPAVTITSPLSAASVSKATAPANKILVTGACETGLPVLITLQGVAGTTTAVCASGSYSADINVVQGTMSIVVNQTDGAGNLGSATASNISVDTVAPVAVTIGGIASVNGGDTVFDNRLLEVGPNISFTPVSDGASYNIAILQGNTVLCQSTTAGPLSTTTEVSLSSCALGNNSSYKVRAIVTDAAGNSTESNYNFTTQFPLPTITSITTSGITSGVAPKDSVIVYNLTFNKNITVTGTPTILLNVKGGGKAIGYSGLVSSRTLTFTYTVEDGENANPISFASTSLGGSFTLRDAATNEIINAPAIPTALYANLIKVDTVPPAPVTSLVLGAVPAFYNRTPTISYTVPTDSDTLSVEVTVRSGSTQVVQSSAHISGQFLSVGSSGLEKGTLYTVSVVTVDGVGNKSTASNITYSSFSCPANYVYIYNSTVNANPFCIAPIEARNASGNAMFAAAAYSAVPMEYNYNDSQALCSAMGTKYDLPTTSEWNAVADLIAKRPDNWVQGVASGATASANYVFVGNTGAGSSALADYINTSNACYPAGSSGCGTANAHRRKLYLPPIGTAAAQEIWDFSGNMFEYTKGPDLTEYNTINEIIPNLPTGAGSLRSVYGTSMSCSGNSLASSPFCGFGSLNFWCSETDGLACVSHTTVNPTYAYVVRGGSVRSTTAIASSTAMGENAGIFAALRGATATTVYFNTGFRCVYHP